MNLNWKSGIAGAVVVLLAAAALWRLNPWQSTLPARILVPLPGVSENGKVKWTYEENKTSAAIDSLVLVEDERNKRYQPGDEIKLMNTVFVLKEIKKVNGDEYAAELILKK
ncbi:MULTISPECIES: hypothetical protein [unclassified Paenibacillus]|uniref:hypothetical protein n=1 Tax=unclassified Paenibacillus TaxID=185978 RepID=UPI000953A0F2|nr:MULTISPECIES: hypothetical protein [unclassified Paenibacillus]ASS68539.1 hypothetical protein CIC07_22185 [Paenibacillus sp. RUD330]SIR63019.1 hypothetical protein SAMN05880555_4495 [Paenibacillus sp. RU4X]SIR71515.1 hypothetical protein SAMN05880570_4497 [Paenibacillus sp. RU4T]